jgi:hypothetical protein
VLPIAALIALTSFSPGTPVSQHYLLPFSAALATLTGALVHAAHIVVNVRIRQALAFLTASGLALHTIATGLGIALRDPIPESDRPSYGTAFDLPLRQSGVMTAALAQCARVVADDNPFEKRLKLRNAAISAVGRADKVMDRGAAAIGPSDAIVLATDGPTCVLRTRDSAAPPNAQTLLRVQSALGESVLYGIAPDVAQDPKVVPVLTNIGWTWLGADAPTRAPAGSAIALTQRWRITSLPDEPHAEWRYDPFVRIIDRNGAIVAEADGVSVPGAAWRVGDVLMATVRINAPKDVGDYRVELSLYDRERQQNAAYIEAPGQQPSLARVVTLTVPNTP